MLFNDFFTQSEVGAASVQNVNGFNETEKYGQTNYEKCAFEDGGWYRDNSDHDRHLLWSITGACNYRCRHCFMSAPQEKFTEPSLEELIDIVRQIDDCGIRKVSLTGGEPLYSPYIFDIVEELKKREISLSMIHTNGRLVTEELLNRLEEMNIHPAFQISFDGIGWHDWMRGVPGSEKAALDAFRLLQRRGYRTGATMVLHRNNLSVVNDSICLLEELGVEHVKIHVATPSGLWVNEPKHFISQDEVNQLFYDTIIPKFFESGAGIGVQFCMMLEYLSGRQKCIIPAERFDGMKSSGERFACGAVGKNIYISPEGYVLSCMHLAGTKMQSFFENLHKKTLHEILTASNYCDISQLRMHEVIGHNDECRDCVYRFFCGAGCRACACGENGTDYLGVDQETCNFFRHGWYEKALELCRRYSQTRC